MGETQGKTKSLKWSKPVPFLVKDKKVLGLGESVKGGYQEKHSKQGWSVV